MTYLQRKKFLSFIRGGDYAHAGEVEAIEMAIAEIDKPGNRSILDVGCGLGGTAKYLQDQFLSLIVGLDIQEEAIQYAHAKYEDLLFIVGDACRADDLFEPDSFDLFLMFNSFFCLADQAKALSSLAKIAKPDSELVIFDFSCKGTLPENPFKGGSVNHFNPIDSANIGNLLKNSGWTLLKLVDISSNFSEWYRRFLAKMTSMKTEAISQFGEQEFNNVFQNFSKTLELLKSGQLGGCLVYCKTKSSS